MPAPSTWRRPILPFGAALILAFAGCGGNAASHASGASSPAAAVEQFLAPFADEKPTPHGFRATKEMREFWASTCDQIDPRLRSVMRFYEEDDATDPRVNCGAAVVVLVTYTGDTGEMLQPSRISGSPVSAETSADASIVTVEMRYESPERHGTTAPPPAKATIKVLVIKRDGSWWVATPQALNPLHAAQGGFDASELREQYERLLAAG
jgi:hypothetical protein